MPTLEMHETLPFSRAEIEDFLPHRGHALFLINAIVEDWHVEAEAQWEASHPHLDGHFPKLPIVPGVFLIEAAAQSVGVILANRPGTTTRSSARTELAVLAGINESRLHHVVHPGERVRFKVDVEPVIEGKYFAASGSAQNSRGEKILTVNLNVALVPYDSFSTH